MASTYAQPYRVRAEIERGCKKWLGKETTEEVTEFKYLGMVLCRRDKVEH